jgi:hypothetical protein
MKTLVITGGDAPLPSDLDEVIRRGSTIVERRRASDVAPSAGPFDADRVVFWSSAPDASMRRLVGRLARAEARVQKETIVFITSAPGDVFAGISPTEIFVWPQDKDRLMMAFMTGA